MPIMPPPDPVTDHTDHIPPRLSFSRVLVNKPLTTCYGEGVNKPSDTDTPEMNENSPPSSPRHFRRRHSNLFRQESPMEKSIESSYGFPEPRSTSPKILSPAKRDQLAELERSQKPSDTTRTDLESSQNNEEETANKHREQERVDMDMETHMLRGGWMHRSRASCELLQDHKYKNVGGD